MTIRQDRHGAETGSPAGGAARSISWRLGRTVFSAVTMQAAGLIASVRATLARPMSNGPGISCMDPEAAYLQACTTAPPFYYVSPVLYGLGATAAERNDARAQPRNEA